MGAFELVKGYFIGDPRKNAVKWRGDQLRIWIKVSNSLPFSRRPSPRTRRGLNTWVSEARVYHLILTGRLCGGGASFGLHGARSQERAGIGFQKLTAWA